MNKRQRRENEMVAAIEIIPDVPTVMETQDFIAEINEITTVETDDIDGINGTVLWTFAGSEWADLTPIERARATRYNYELGVYHSSKEPRFARNIADKVLEALIPLGFVSFGELAKVEGSGNVATINFAMTV